MVKILPKRSEQTDRLRKLLRKNETWKWGPEQETHFNRIKQMLIGSPYLAHYAKEKDNKKQPTPAQPDKDYRCGKNKLTEIQSW